MSSHSSGAGGWTWKEEELSTNVKLYLILEDAMVALDEQDNLAADQVRDGMDLIWFKLLTEDERNFLNSPLCRSTTSE